MVGLDRGGEGFTQRYFDSRGVARLYSMPSATASGSCCETRPDCSPLDFWQRFSGEFSADGGTIRGRRETRNGSSWERDFDLTYRKVR